MDVATDQYKSGTNRASHLSALLHTLLDMVVWPVKFFSLTKEDRLKAGVYVRGGRHDE